MRYLVTVPSRGEPLTLGTPFSTRYLDGSTGAEAVAEQFALSLHEAGDRFEAIDLLIRDEQDVQYTVHVDVATKVTFEARAERLLQPTTPNQTNDNERTINE